MRSVLGIALALLLSAPLSAQQARTHGQVPACETPKLALDLYRARNDSAQVAAYYQRARQKVSAGDCFFTADSAQVVIRTKVPRPDLPVLPISRTASDSLVWWIHRDGLRGSP